MRRPPSGAVKTRALAPAALRSYDRRMREPLAGRRREIGTDAYVRAWRCVVPGLFLAMGCGPRAVPLHREAPAERVSVRRSAPSPTTTTIVEAEPSGPTAEPLWPVYAAEAERRRLHYVDFSPLDFEDAAEPTAAEVRAWLGRQRAYVEGIYETERHRWTGLPREVRARHILVLLDEHAGAEDEAQARQRMSAIVARLRRGEDFAAVARETSDDTGSARRGGDLGWNPRGRMVEPFDTAMFTARPGRLSRVIRTRFGLHVLRVEGVREGDVPRERALEQLAARMLQRQRMALRVEQVATEHLSRLLRGEDSAVLDAELETACPIAPRARGPRYRFTPWFRRGVSDLELVGEADTAGTGTTLSDRVFAESPDSLAFAHPAGTLTVVVERVEVIPADPAGLTPEVRACLVARTRAVVEQIGQPRDDDAGAQESGRQQSCAARRLHGAACRTCVPPRDGELLPGTVQEHPPSRACRTPPAEPASPP